MAIEICSLAKSYGDFRVDIDLRVASDETLVLAGPSGCGKTTALQMIAGLAEPDSGDIRVDGKSVSALPAWKRGIGIVFQDLALFPHLTVEGNVGYGPSVAGLPKPARRELVAESLAAVRLSGYAARRVDTLSGGERQRVAIARALAARPRALLMDEPFSSLDAPLRRALRTEFRELRENRGIPCVFVTHDREEAAAVGDRVAVMENGRVVECGAPRDLFNEPRTAFVARFLGSGAVVDAGLLGRLSAPARSAAAALASGRSLLVPPDAVVVLPSEAEGKDAVARVEEVGFEGYGTGVSLRLEGTDLALRTTLDRRETPPRTGERVGVRIVWELTRTVEDDQRER